MLLSDILSVDRIVLSERNAVDFDRWTALSQLSARLAPSIGLKPETVEQSLVERERLQSTGIGAQVAIPHASHEAVEAPRAALLLCPTGIAFDAIDGQLVTIVLAVMGPKRAAGEHLRTLAHISRLFRSAEVREQLVHSETPSEALAVIKGECERTLARGS